MRQIALFYVDRNFRVPKKAKFRIMEFLNKFSLKNFCESKKKFKFWSRLIDFALFNQLNSRLGIFLTPLPPPPYWHSFLRFKMNGIYFGRKGNIF